MRGGGQSCCVQGMNYFCTGLCSFCAPWNPTAAPGKASPYPERCLCWAHAEQTCRCSPPACTCPPITASSDVITAIVCFSLLPLNICSSVSSTAWKSIILGLGLIWLLEHQESQASLCSLWRAKPLQVCHSHPHGLLLISHHHNCESGDFYTYLLPRGGTRWPNHSELCDSCEE